MSEDAGAEAVRVYSTNEGLCIGIRVSPSAPRNRVVGTHGYRLKVAVAAPPEDNRANKELEGLLAEWAGVPRDAVRVVKGRASRDKVVAFTGVQEGSLRRLLSLVGRKP